MKWFFKYQFLLLKYNTLKSLIDEDLWGDVL